MNKIHTLSALASAIETKEDFSFGLKNFLDYFYAGETSSSAETHYRGRKSTFER
jgi:hypothetical protein